MVELDKGEHRITSSWTDIVHGDCLTTLGITCSNVTFLGKGKDETTVLGGFGIRDLQNITFKNMTVTNPSQHCDGIYMRNTKVELVDVAFKGCGGAGLRIPPSVSYETTLVATRCEFANSAVGAVVGGVLASAKFNNCVFHDNSGNGIFIPSQGTIHLHGEATAIHSNGVFGIYSLGTGTKVLIHLPSHHNTIYNNGTGDQLFGADRFTYSGGTITNVED